MTGRHLENLKRAILQLAPTGPNGFEGLLAAVLTLVCGQPFRLASSGTQRGRDGDSAFDVGATYFEAKLYSGDVPKRDIAVKVMDLMADDQGQVDTWIICSTSAIPAQNAMDYSRTFDSIGIGLVLLDWVDNARLPPLAAVVVMGGEVARDFLIEQINDPIDAKLLSDALIAIDQLAVLPEFASQSERLREEIKNPSVGLGLAKEANRTWLTRIFSCQALASQQLGQPLAPRDTSMDYLQPRTNLCDKLRNAFSGRSSRSVFVVIGAEGTGKSWLLANTWMQSDPASILVMTPAGEFQRTEDTSSLEDFLICKLLAQTGSDLTESNQKRWKRRFAAWKANPDPSNIRITFCIDGLNQNPRYPWLRLIEGASLLLGQLGGQLVVTTRTTHFPAIRQANVANVTRIVVPEWTNSELDAILRTRNINPDVLNGEVFATLKNPRILSIAVNLLDARDIESIDQLSVGRLLFEHLRNCNQTDSSDLSPREFVTVLRELAKEYISRVDAGSEDDLQLFDTRDHSRLAEVSTGRFFRPVGVDPDRYEIVDEGLRLSLGIWLVDALEKEHRNKRDPFARLEVVMEPVAGLDMTAEIVGSATEVACLSDSCVVEVTSAVVRHYVSLQNLPEDKRESFGALVKNSPDAFLEAAKEAALLEDSVSTSDWLEIAILEARNNDRVRWELERKIPEWLSYYCLAPERMMHVSAGNSSAEEVQAERQRVIQNLEKRMEELTYAERNYLEKNLVELDAGDVTCLHRLALYFLAGLPLEKFAGPLFSSAFSGSLTPTTGSPYREFEHLIRFNFVDWFATRRAFLKFIEFIGEERSSVGDWVVVKTLRSTGDLSDAAEAHHLTEVLTAHPERRSGLRLIETYCATDPCDPEAPRPENIGDTVKQYRNMAVDKVGLTRGKSMETHFFDMAMPGVARFEPEAGAGAIRKLSNNTLAREGVAQKLAVLMLLPYSVLLARHDVDALVTYAQSLDENSPNQSGAPDEWLIAQYSLFIALPHLSGNEQLKALSGMHTKTLLLNSLSTIRPADAAVVESLLEKAFADKDTHRLLMLLAAIRHAKSPLTNRAISIVADLLTFPETTVRAEALAIASTHESELLIRRVANIDWDAGGLTPNENDFELWYGSAALVAAVSAGFVEANLALDRMALSHYGLAAARLGNKVARLVAYRVEDALGKVLNLSEMTGLPEMEHAVPDGRSTLPPQIALREASSADDPRTSLERIAETEEQFQDRQRLLQRAYERFSRELTNSDASLVVTNLTAEGMAAVVAARPDIVSAWHALLLKADDVKKRSIYNFAIEFAGAISEGHAESAASLFRAYSQIEPFVRHVVGMAKVPIEAEVLWSHGEIPEISELCTQRLDDCTCDHEIAIEVLAAFIHNQENTLESYVEKLLSTREPAHIARALTVAGFSDESEFAENALSRFKGSKGFVGEAYVAGRGAYDRNRWSRHWYERLQMATTEVEFWRYSVLLSRIVDGRIDLWRSIEPTERLFDAFFPTIQDRIKQRIDRWGGKRKKTLFGDRVPHTMFLIRDYTVN